MDIKVMLEKDEDGIFVATVPALPGCISQEKTAKSGTSTAYGSTRVLAGVT